MKTVTFYIAFAIVATVANIGSQDLCTRIYAGEYPVVVSVFVGTAVGLIIKYLLDKKYIFQYQPKNLTHDTFAFTMYAGMGLLTTAIFWGFEFGFDQYFGTKSMRYAGGVLGLAIGYYIKYRLDKRFVFVPRGT